MKALSISGPTGSGKTTSLKNWILSDIRNGLGVAVVDPKDDLIDSLLPHIPPRRERDVILLDATDREWPLGFNPLGEISPEKRSLATSELVAVLRRYFSSSSWGPRMENILTNVILALLETPWPSTLLDIPKVLLEPAYTQAVLTHVHNPGVRQFFEVEFEQILKRRGDAIEPILNKVNPWLTFPELRNIIGQSTSSFHIRQAMDEGKILLVRIPKGTLGEDMSSLIGALLVAKIQLAAHSRVDIAPERRRPFFLYCDEFQNFVTSSFAQIVTEARGFNLGLVCANQYPEQLSRDLQLAIAKNAATSVQCINHHGRYHLQVRRLEDEGTDLPPLILTPARPLSPGDPQRAARVRALSRQQYGRPRAQVEREILAKFNDHRQRPAEPATKARSQKSGRRGIDIEEE